MAANLPSCTALAECPHWKYLVSIPQGVAALAQVGKPEGPSPQSLASRSYPALLLWESKARLAGRVFGLKMWQGLVLPPPSSQRWGSARCVPGTTHQQPLSPTPAVPQERWQAKLKKANKRNCVVGEKREGRRENGLDFVWGFCFVFIVVCNFPQVLFLLFLFFFLK